MDIQDQIDELGLNGGGRLILPPGQYDIDKQINLHEGVTLEGYGVTLKAIEQMNAMIRVQGDGAAVKSLKLDANHRAAIAFLSSGFTNIRATNLHVFNFSYGIRLGSSKDRAGADLTVEGCRVDQPGKNANYPILIASGIGNPFVERAYVKSNYVKGSGSHHTHTNRATADQIVLQGCHDSQVTDNASFDGGENGMSIGRGCKNVLIFGNLLANNDGVGLAAGAGLVIVQVNNVAGFEKGDRVFVRGKAVTGSVQFVDKEKRQIWSNATSRGFYSVGDVLTNGEAATFINKVIRNDRYRIISNTAYGNSRNEAGTFGDLGGIIVQQCDNALIDSNCCFDDGEPKTQGYGLTLVQCSVILGNNDFNGNKLGRIKENGEVIHQSTKCYGDLTIGARLIHERTPSIVLDRGIIDVSGLSRAMIDTEGKMSLDTLRFIRGGVDGQRVTLQITSNHRLIILQGSTKIDGLRITKDVMITGVHARVEVEYVENVRAWLLRGSTDHLSRDSA